MTKVLRVSTLIATTLLVVFSPSGAMEKKAVNPLVVMETSMGDITIELFQDRAPKTVANFLEYVKTGFYRDTVFHRVIKGFMIQGGGLTEEMKQKPTRAPVENEAANGYKNVRGSVAMARTSEIHSATAQFFINTVDNSFLDHRSKSPDGFGYCVFGKVTDGMDVVGRIEGSPTGNKGMYRDVPVLAVIIKDVRLKD
ncbi:MAG: peptidyl-prolyl cis-trans isomerase [Deltaproteobacteria bacterium]|nr:peptidyl-prolyl cis-trans isomerase [Deltaproteobacteria bacterium]